MQSVFNYENKVMQALMYIGDLIIINLLFLLCCIPVFTIGAAQAGMFNALRVLSDPEDDTSVSAAFFRGFVNGFGTITLAFLIFAVLIVLLVLNLMALNAFESAQMENVPVVISYIGLAIVAMFQSLVTLFHSRFSCKLLHLFRNAWLLFIAYPLRSILAFVILWAPIVLMFVATNTFLTLAPLFLSLGCSGLSLFAVTLMKKPFQGLIDFRKKQEEQAEQEAAEAEQDTQATPEEEAQC